MRLSVGVFNHEAVIPNQPREGWVSRVMDMMMFPTIDPNKPKASPERILNAAFPRNYAGLAALHLQTNQ